MSYELRERVVCAVCRQPLNAIRELGTNELRMWTHQNPLVPEPHEPVPASEADLSAVSVCDFCSKVNPTWCYPTKEGWYEIEGRKVAHDDEAWLACIECHDLIEEDRWSEVCDRTLSTHRKQGVPEFLMPSLRERVGDIHKFFRSQRQGEALRYPDEVTVV